jgi:NAD(P)-dependent dehydrogenase (short-subunit alcohol dehydrogenase family)
VTGSSSRIGAAIATSQAQHGATVVVNSATSVAAGERLAAALPRGSYLQASRHDIPDLCIPAGTRNHFALDLGLARQDLIGAVDALHHGSERGIWAKSTAVCS